MLLLFLGACCCALIINLCTFAHVLPCVCRVVWIFVLNLLALVVCFIYKVGQSLFRLLHKLKYVNVILTI